MSSSSQKRSLRLTRPGAASAVTLFALVVLAGLARGDERRKKAGEGDRERARAHSERAAIHYKLGHFEPALREYQQAYELFPVPGLLFNIGQSYLGLKECDKAAFSFEMYLSEQPDSSNRGLVTELLADCRRQLEGENDEPSPSAAQGTSTGEPWIANDHEPQAVADEPRFMATDPRTDPLSARANGKPVYKKWWFWAAVGGTAALVGATFYVATRDPEPDPSLGRRDWGW